jgi:hypothetical protein
MHDACPIGQSGLPLFRIRNIALGIRHLLGFIGKAAYLAPLADWLLERSLQEFGRFNVEVARQLDELEHVHATLARFDLPDERM